MYYVHLFHSIVIQWGIYSNEAFKEVPKYKSHAGNISVVCNGIKSIAFLRYIASHKVKCMKVLVDVDGLPEKMLKSMGTSERILR